MDAVELCEQARGSRITEVRIIRQSVGCVDAGRRGHRRVAAEQHGGGRRPAGGIGWLRHQTHGRQDHVLLQVVDGAEGAGTGNAVRHQPVLFLKSADGLKSLGIEDAVGRDVEVKFVVQPLLQIRNQRPTRTHTECV